MQWVGRIAAGIGLGACLACAPVATAGGGAPPAVAADDGGHALAGVYGGFAHWVRGGADRPVFVVDSLADAGAGSLRRALADARAAGGGHVRFAIGGDIVLGAGVDVPENTTLDALDAPHPGITLWGDAVGGGRGVVNVLDGNVIVRGLRIRNAGNDGIHVAPKNGFAIAGVVIDHCSITNSADGGIDVTGADGLTVRDVTLSWNYVAGNGAPCDKGLCGGGALVKYGVDRVSVHANLWDKNLRRNPTVDGEGIAGGTLADIRGNVVRAYAQSGVQVRGGARANVVGNFFDRPGAVWLPDAFVYMADNRPPEPGNQALPFDVAAPLEPVAEEAVLAGAGAQPRDALDDLYLNGIATWEALKALQVGPGDTPRAPAPPTPTPTPAPGGGGAGVFPFPPLPPNPVDAAALARAGEVGREAARAASRREKRWADAAALHTEVVRMLQGATGPLAADAHRVMAGSEYEIAVLARRRLGPDLPAALQHARASVGHCEVGACDRRTVRRGPRLVRRVTRDLARRDAAPPPWEPPLY